MHTQMLIETLSHSECGMMTETVDQGKNLYFSGVFMEAEKRNRNNRIYPITEMRRVVEAAQRTIKEEASIPGELDHPTSLQISSDRISHVITGLKLEGNQVFGKAKILDKTPCGAIAKVLIQEPTLRMGISSRGAGDVNEQGIVSNFNFITADIVTIPSCQTAYPSAVYESLMNHNGGYKILTLAEQIAQDQDSQKYLVKEMKGFIAELVKYSK